MHGTSNGENLLDKAERFEKELQQKEAELAEKRRIDEEKQRKIAELEVGRFRKGLQLMPSDRQIDSLRNIMGCGLILRDLEEIRGLKKRSSGRSRKWLYESCVSFLS